MRKASAAFVAVAVLLLGSGCDSAVAPPGGSDVDVDTPELREQKAAAGIEPCEPGTGADGELPALTLPCLGGGADVDLSTLQGPLLLNLWASSCGPCVREMPALQEFHATYGDRVAVIGLDVVDTYPAAALDLAARTGATYPMLADPGGEIYSQDDLRVAVGLPQFILVDADGAVVHQQSGGVTSVDEVVALVETHLGGAL